MSESVPVRTFRANAATYLRRAEGGERIVVTVAGRPVAQLGPLDPAGDVPTVEDLAARGLVVAARRSDRPRTDRCRRRLVERRASAKHLLKAGRVAPRRWDLGDILRRNATLTRGWTEEHAEPCPERELELGRRGVRSREKTLGDRTGAIR